MPSRRKLQKQVELRAGARCEYCHMHQSLQGARFHLEHIVPLAHGGTTTLDNLAWACPGCNLRKSDQVEAADPDTRKHVLLFHPRSQRWQDHFSWEEHSLVGQTPVGRATIKMLDLNHARRVLIRQAEQQFGLFPPDEDVASP